MECASGYRINRQKRYVYRVNLCACDVTYTWAVNCNLRSELGHKKSAQGDFWAGLFLRKGNAQREKWNVQAVTVSFVRSVTFTVSIFARAM